MGRRQSMLGGTAWFAGLMEKLFHATGKFIDHGSGKGVQFRDPTKQVNLELVGKFAQDGSRTAGFQA